MANVTKYSRLHGLKQHEFIMSQFWMLEAWNQGFDRVMLPLKHVGEPSLPPPTIWWSDGKLWGFSACKLH